LDPIALMSQPPANRPPESKPKRSPRRWFWWVLGIAVTIPLIWILWTEQQPEQEAWLRNEAQARLQSWFPEVMKPRPSEVGFHPVPAVDRGQVLVVLIHGLDEPGGVFDGLITALEQAGYTYSHFLYPNDQTIPDSTDLLASHWPELPDHQPVVLLGHSMGGLVIRDFVTRWRPALDADSAEVIAALLIGTPNQGSEWARLRIWLELRDYLGAESTDEFSLFKGLRDGTGAAKVDLRPGSRFLIDLNSRPWPDDVPMRILGGAVSVEEDLQRAGLVALERRLGDPDWSRRFERWLTSGSRQLGDGVVPVDALPAPGAPEPDIVQATHRGLLKPDLIYEGEPPGIAWTLDQLARISGPVER